MKLNINYKKKTAKTRNTWRLNIVLLNNKWITEEIQQEIKKYLEINENRNMMIQNMEHSKSSSKKKVNSYTSLPQETRNIWNYLTLHLKQLEKEQNKTQS